MPKELTLKNIKILVEDVLDEKLIPVYTRLDTIEHDLREFREETHQRFDKVDARLNRFDHVFDELSADSAVHTRKLDLLYQDGWVTPKDLCQKN